MKKSSAAPAILVAVVISVLLAALVGAAQPDQNSNMNQNTNSNMSASKGNTNTSMLKSSDQKFMMEAAMGGMEEVELGKVAATRGSSDAVKQFGQRMVEEHTKANEELMQLASTKGVTLPTALDDKHKADVDKMSQLSGADFDRAYAKEAGVKDHNKAVKLFQNEADKGKDADVKAFATKTLPTIQEHLRMAQELDNSMRGTKSAADANTNMSGDDHKAKNKNKNKNSNSSTMNSNMSGNGNMSNSNVSDNSNMSNSNSDMSGNMNTSNSNMSDNSNMSNSNGNSNHPR